MLMLMVIDLNMGNREKLVYNMLVLVLHFTNLRQVGQILLLREHSDRHSNTVILSSET